MMLFTRPYEARRQSAKATSREHTAVITILVAVVVTLFLVACAQQPAPAGDAEAGLLMGLFHGLVAIPSLVGSVFFEIRVYAFPNNGFWYDFGFVAGFVTSLLGLILTSIARLGGMIT